MGSTEDKICELHRLDDASALGDVAAALELRGIEADVWPVGAQRLTPWAADAWRLMVRCRDVVYARWVAAAFAAFTLAATFLFHNYWAMPDAQQLVQKLMFLKNLAIAGGLLLIVAFGPGRWSIDKR